MIYINTSHQIRKMDTIVRYLELYPHRIETKIVVHTLLKNLCSPN
jgi:hypothetical protein